ncbi:MAG: serine hydrolase [Betaproteobacteria bacterium]
MSFQNLFGMIFYSFLFLIFSSGNAWAIGDGDWFVSIYCAARKDVQPIRSPYSVLIPKWVVKNGTSDFETRNPSNSKQVERWMASVKDNAISVTASGTRGPGDEWSYKFEGPNDTPQLAMLEGAIYDSTNKKLRNCTLTFNENISFPNLRGVPFVSDRTLMREGKDVNAYLVKSSPAVTTLNFTDAQQKFPSKIQAGLNRLQESKYTKAIVLVDDKSVYLSSKNIVDSQSLFYTASVAKTLTSVAIGQAMCQGYFKLDDEIVSYLPELKGKTLGAAKVKDLLMMASGVADVSGNLVGGSGNFFKEEDRNSYWNDSNFSFSSVILREEFLVSHRMFFSDVKPGQRFSYSNINPMWLGLIINRSTGKTYAEWLQEYIFNPAGFEGGGFVSQDKQGVASADGVFGIRLKIADWVRFAKWFRVAYEQNDCLGQYLRDASRKQIQNGQGQSYRRTASEFFGYGYLIWTDHRRSDSAFWALGYGGQMIGWNKKNHNIIITMMNLEDSTDQIVNLYENWISESK